MPSRQPETRSAIRPSLAIGLVAFVAAVLFAPTYGFEFIWDDFRTMHETMPAIEGPSSLFLPQHGIADLGRYFRPAAYAVYWIVWALGGGPATFHLLAAALHAACAAMVAGLAFRLLRPGRDALVGAALAGLVFAAHPVHVEAVAGMGGLNETLAAFWMLVALLAYDGARASARVGLYVLALTATLLGFLSKETALSLPLLAAALELGPLPNGARPRLAHAGWRIAGLALPLLVYFGLRRVAMGGWITSAAVTDLEPRGLGAAPAALLYYLGRVTAPVAPCHFVPQMPPLGLLGAVLVAVALALAAWLVVATWRRTFAVAYGVAILFVAMAPVVALAVYPLATTALAERYGYVPSIGIALLAGAAASLPGPAKRLRQAVVLALVGLGAYETVTRLPPFANDEVFWTAAAACAPQHCLPLINLADVRLARGEADAAGDLYRRASGLACARYQRGLAFAHLGIVDFRRGELKAAEESLQAALDLAPEYSVTSYMLARTALARSTEAGRGGDTAAERRELETARDRLAAALAVRPADPEYLYAAGQVDYFLGERESARARLSQALRLAPQHEAAAAAQTMLAHLGR